MYLKSAVRYGKSQVTNIDSTSAESEMRPQASESGSKSTSDQLWDPVKLFCRGEPIYEDEPHRCIYILDNGERCTIVNGKPRRALAIAEIKHISKLPIDQIRKHEIRLVLSQVLCLRSHNNQTSKGIEAFNEELRRCGKRVRREIQDQETARRAENLRPKPKPEPTQDERDSRFSQDMERIRASHKEHLKMALFGVQTNNQVVPSTDWGVYNQRWERILNMLRQTYQPSNEQGAYSVMPVWFATRQPAYVHELIPWPVPGFEAWNVTAEDVRAFYKEAIMTHKYNSADKKEEATFSAADMAYYRDVILVEKRRWWPLVEHLGGEEKLKTFVDDTENVLKRVKPERVLLTVLRVLDEMGRKVEAPILKLDPDGGVFSLPKTWKEYLGGQTQ